MNKEEAKIIYKHIDEQAKSNLKDYGMHHFNYKGRDYVIHKKDDKTFISPKDKLIKDKKLPSISDMFLKDPKMNKQIEKDLKRHGRSIQGNVTFYKDHNNNLRYGYTEHLLPTRKAPVTLDTVKTGEFIDSKKPFIVPKDISKIPGKIAADFRYLFDNLGDRTRHNMKQILGHNNWKLSRVFDSSGTPYTFGIAHGTPVEYKHKGGTYQIPERTHENFVVHFNSSKHTGTFNFRSTGNKRLDAKVAELVTRVIRKRPEAMLAFHKAYSKDKINAIRKMVSYVRL